MAYLRIKNLVKGLTIFSFCTVAVIYSNAILALEKTQANQTIPVAREPMGITMSPSGKTAYVCNYEAGSVQAIDTATNTVKATIKVGNAPSDIVILPAENIGYVANSVDGTLSEVDLFTNMEIRKINLGANPVFLAITPDGLRLYVVTLGYNGIDGNVYVIDTTNNQIIRIISIRGYPYGITITPDGNKVYVLYFDNQVSVISTIDNIVKKTIEVQGSQQCDPYGITVSSDGSTVYVACSLLDQNWNYRGIVTAINVLTDNIKYSYHPVGLYPTGLALSPNGRYAYTTSFNPNNDGYNRVEVLDTKTGTVINSIPVGKQPFDIATLPNGNTAYVSNSGDSTVSVISLAPVYCPKEVECKNSNDPQSCSLSDNDAQWSIGNPINSLQQGTYKFAYVNRAGTSITQDLAPICVYYFNGYSSIGMTVYGQPSNVVYLPDPDMGKNWQVDNPSNGTYRCDGQPEHPEQCPMMNFLTATAKK